jgi:hypothetical protein
VVIHDIHKNPQAQVHHVCNVRPLFLCCVLQCYQNSWSGTQELPGMATFLNQTQVSTVLVSVGMVSVSFGVTKPETAECTWVPQANPADHA